jgi:hypothetical protein
MDFAMDQFQTCSCFILSFVAVSLDLAETRAACELKQELNGLGFQQCCVCGDVLHNGFPSIPYITT